MNRLAWALCLMSFMVLSPLVWAEDSDEDEEVAMAPNAGVESASDEETRAAEAEMDAAEREQSGDSAESTRVVEADVPRSNLSDDEDELPEERAEGVAQRGPEDKIGEEGDGFRSKSSFSGGILDLGGREETEDVRFDDRRSMLRYHADAIHRLRRRMNVEYFLGPALDMNFGNNQGTLPYGSLQIAWSPEIAFGARSEYISTVFQNEETPMYGFSFTAHYYLQSAKFQGLWLQAGIPFVFATLEVNGEQGAVYGAGIFGTAGYRFTLFGLLNAGVCAGAKAMFLPGNVTTVFPMVSGEIGIVI